MRGIILAAGRGSRMRGLTGDRPKCLVEFQDKPLLGWQLTAMREAGICEIAVVTGYRNDLLADRGLTEFHNSRWSETNMVSSLACAKSWLLSGPCIVSYSDIVYNSEAVKLLMNCDASLAITFDPHWLTLWKKRFLDPLREAETFRMNSNGLLTEIGNKPRTLDEIQGQYMGLLRFTPSGWEEAERIRTGLTRDERDTLQMTEMLQKVIDAGRVPVKAVPYEGIWYEFDSVEDLLTFGD